MKLKNRLNSLRSNKRVMSLRTRFIIYLALSLIIIMFIGAMLIITRQVRTIKTLAIQKGKSVSNIVARDSIDPMLYQDVLKLDELVRTALSDKEILYIFIEDKDGKIINSAIDAFNIPEEEYGRWGIDIDDVRKTLLRLQSNKEILNIKTPIMQEGESFGTVYLGLSTRNLQEFTTESVISMVIITVVVIVLMSLVLYTLFKRLLFNPLTDIVNVSKMISSGNLNVSAKIKRDDEIGVVASTLNQMVINIKSMILTIKDLFSELQETGIQVNNKSRIMRDNIEKQFASLKGIFSGIEGNDLSIKEISALTDKLRSASESTSSSTIELAASSEEIADNMETLTRETENMTAALQEMSASLNSLVEVVDVVSRAVMDTSTSISEIETSIQEIYTLSTNSKELAREINEQTESTGLTSINATIEGMKKIKESVERTGEVISILDSKSKEIDRIVQVIDEVTDRTSLLSLNASILAAQAGEKGRSFAVVADEMKMLSNDTASSTKEISNIIAMIQKEIKTAVKSMETGMEKVSDGLRLAEAAGGIFHKITRRTDGAAEIAMKVDTATHEQSEGLRMVVGAVQSIEERVKKLSVVVREQKEGMDNIVLSIERLREVVHHVRFATDEQKKASAQISQSAETVSEMSSAIAGSISRVSEGSAEILTATEDIKQNASLNINISSEMVTAVNTLLKMAGRLKEGIEKFQI